MPFIRPAAGSLGPAFVVLAVGAVFASASCADSPPANGGTAGAAGAGSGGGESGGESSGVGATSSGSGAAATAGDGPSAAAGAAVVDSGGAGGESASGGAPGAPCTEPTLACATTKLVGTAVNLGAVQDVPSYAEVLGREFDYVTPENVMKWGPLQPTQATWDFGPADSFVAIAEANGQPIKAHALVWHIQMPDWASALGNAALIDAVHQHITTTTQHFRGKVRAWDVVNEAIGDDGGIRPGVHTVLGVSGMADAFKWARAGDPDAKLFYNDYGIEGLSAKSDEVLQLMKDLIAAGAPIDGIGFQSHFSTKSYPSAVALRANMQRFADLGLSVNLSELDVRTMEVPGTKAQRQAAQAIAYQEAASACAAAPSCEALTLWGFTDAYSWIDEYFGADDPLPFDEQYAKKPAYATLLAGLAGTGPDASANMAAGGDCESLDGWSVFAGGTLANVAAGRTGMACRVSARTASHHGPALALTGKVQKGQTLSVTAYARLNQTGHVGLTLKKVEPGVADEYVRVAWGAATASGWTLLSGNLTFGWQTAPTELVLYFESPDLGGGTFANVLVDDVTLQVLSTP